MTDPLITKAERGTLSRDELTSVINELQNPERNRDPHTLLSIIGEAGGSELATTVEPFLESQDDPMLAGLALFILTNRWGLASQYRAKLIDFVKGVAWDREDDVRLTAIASSGEYLRERPDEEMLDELLAIAQNGREDGLLRQAALAALGRAVGMSWRQLPKVKDGVAPGSELAQEILRRARELGK
jgi:hypothetical protein